MAKCLEILGIVFGVIGLIAAALTCALPIWKVTAFIGSNIITAQVIWEGLWMSCVVQSTGQMQCRIYDSMLALPQDLQPARVMTVISIIVGILGVLISIVGTNMMWGAAKAKVMIISGIFFILASILVLVPVCWTTHNIIQDSYHRFLAKYQRREIGASLYIGWASAALFLIGGVLMCSRCPQNERYIPQQVVYTKTDGGHNNRNNV